MIATDTPLYCYIDLYDNMAWGCCLLSEKGWLPAASNIATVPTFFFKECGEHAIYNYPTCSSLLLISKIVSQGN